MSIVCKKKSIIFANLFIFFWLYKNINHGFGAFTQHERTYYPFNNQTQVKAHWWFLEVRVTAHTGPKGPHPPRTIQSLRGRGGPAVREW